MQKALEMPDLDAKSKKRVRKIMKACAV